jgi:Pyridoxamine 5'-phosphate oxidase like
MCDEQPHAFHHREAATTRRPVPSRTPDSHHDAQRGGPGATNPQVNVSFSNTKQSEWTSVSGTAEVVHDRARAEELWSAPLKVWFEDGLDTPGLTLIRVRAETAEYWEGPSSKVARLVGAARAAAAGDKDEFPATNETVELRGGAPSE